MEQPIQANELPPLHETVIVQTHEFRCLGYRDKGGVWRGCFQHEKISEVVDWEPMPAAHLPSLFRG